MGPHLDPATIDQLLRDELDDTSRAQAETHLDACAPCREALESARDDDDLLSDLRSAWVPLEEDAHSTEAIEVEGYADLVEMHRGGQGVVYRAVHEASGRAVALKVLLGGAHASARDRFRFEREIELASSLRHPNIVRILDRGLANGSLFCAMELIEGSHLDDHLAETKPSRPERLELFRKICEAVAYAHRHGVVHRDLKPSNLVVDANGEPHILDFGLAKSADEGRAAVERLTRTGQFMGTLAYASPEQVRGGGEPIGTASDVYSLGFLLYEMLVESPPYPVSGSLTSIVTNITTTEPADPRTRARTVDEDLATILQTALAKAPERRYPSADSFARDIAHYLAGEPIEAHRDSRWHVMRKAVRRHRAAIAIAAAFALVVGGSLAVIVEERLRSIGEREKATLIRRVFEDILTARGTGGMMSDANLVEVLEGAARTLDDSLADAPDTEAAVHFAIGEAYAQRLLFREAIPHLEKAIERHRKAGAAEAADLGRALALLGRIRARQTSPESVPILTEAVELRRQVHGADHPLVAESLRELGFAWMIHPFEENPALAERYFRESLEILHARRVRDDRQIAATLYRFGMLDMRVNGWESPVAEQKLREAIEHFDRAPDQPSSDEVAALNTPATLLQNTGRVDEARARLERPAVLTRRHFGANEVPDMLRGFARLHHSEGNDAAARRMSRDALAASLESWAERRPSEARRLRDIAAQLSDHESSDANAPWLAAFVAIREFEGRGSYELGSWMGGVAELLVKGRYTTAAESVLRESLDVHCRLYGTDCPIRRENLARLALMLYDEDRADEAEPFAREVIEIADRTGDTECKLAKKCREHLDSAAAASVRDAGARG